MIMLVADKHILCMCLLDVLPARCVPVCRENKSRYSRFQGQERNTLILFYKITYFIKKCHKQCIQLNMYDI